jgi:hypothetical protein
LCNTKRLDQDGDGIPSYLEEFRWNGYMYGYFITTASNALLIIFVMLMILIGWNSNFLDVDDDADGL